MTTKLSFMKLFLLYWSYLYFGAMVFYLVETKNEKHMMNLKLKERAELNRLMQEHLAPGDPELRQQILINASEYCGLPMVPPSPEEREYHTWTFYHCLFFCLTIITTVGYGNIYPQTEIGRFFVIFYALLGLPINGILFSRIGQVYWDLIERLHGRFHKFSHKIRLMLIIKWGLFLAPGFIFFVFLPAIVFTHFEVWTYGIAIYYAFVTLSTIGFGDYAATFEANLVQKVDEWYYVYQVFVLAWFILGLGYTIMITQYLIGHYGKAHFHQLDFEKSMDIRDELTRFGNAAKKDFKAVRCSLKRSKLSKCCKCWRKKEDQTDQEGTDEKTITRTQSCPDLRIP